MEEFEVSPIDLRLEALKQAIAVVQHFNTFGSGTVLRVAKEFENYLLTGSTEL